MTAVLQEVVEGALKPIVSRVHALASEGMETDYVALRNTTSEVFHVLLRVIRESCEKRFEQGAEASRLIASIREYADQTEQIRGIFQQLITLEKQRACHPEDNLFDILSFEGAVRLAEETHHRLLSLLSFLERDPPSAERLKAILALRKNDQKYDTSEATAGIWGI